ncbi:MAG: HAD hydrolase family protein [Oscillospiraceae bacterium]|nr:HAD hydrolase family protein [Oscillospiraceae bacterium]
MKAVFFDIDGTLTVNNRPPHPEDAAAIRALRARGHRAFLCTARSRGYILDNLLAVGFDGLVAGAGAYVALLGGQADSLPGGPPALAATPEETVLCRRRVDADTVRRVAAHFFTLPGTCLLEGERDNYRIGPDIGCGFEALPSPDLSDAWCAAHPITKFTLYGSGLRPGTLALLEHAFTVIQHPTYAEAVLKGCSKAGGVKMVCEALSIPLADTVGFGDSLNDLDMLQAVGIGVAMGDAPDEVRTAAAFVTGTQPQAGVAQGLKRLGLI